MRLTNRMIPAVLLLLLGRISSTLGDYGGSAHAQGYEFAFWDDKTDYIGALIKCETQQVPGWLAEPKDPELQQAVELAVYGSSYVWLGATDLSAENRWLWLDTTDLYWTNWEAGEPNNMSDEDCMLMLKSGEWNDKDCCYRPDGYVCQSHDDVTYTFGRSEFEIIESPSTFWQAEEACIANGARLVEVNDLDSETNLRKIVKFDTQQLWVSQIESGTGLSKCAVIDNEGTKDEDCAAIRAAALCEKARPHALKVSQHTLSISTGSRVEVECSAEGYPVPDTAWYKDGQEMLAQAKSPGRSTLVIENAKSDDAGLYLCYATNDVNKGKYDVRTFMNLKVTEE